MPENETNKTNHSGNNNKIDQNKDNSHNKDSQESNQSNEKNWYDYDRADSEIIVKIGPFRLYYQNYYTAISLSLDIFVGLLYFVGSVFSLFDQTAQYSTYLFILGGFLFVARPVMKLIDNFRHYARSERKQAVEESYFNNNKFFAVKHYEDLPESNQSDDYLGEEYNSEYYEDDSQ